MGRVIRISAVLMGVLLVGLTGGLKWARSEEQADILVLWEGQQTPNHLSWLYPNAPRLTPIISDAEIIKVVGTSPNGEWLYFVGGKERDFGPDTWDGTLYRVRVGGTPEVIVPTIGWYLIRKSPDNAWIYYPREYEALNGSNVVQFTRLELATAKREVLKTIETSKDVFVSRDWSYNPEWIRYQINCGDWSNPCTEHFRISADGKVVEQIPDRPYEIEVGGVWLTSVTNDQNDSTLYWREPNGQLRPVTTAPIDSALQDADVERWLPIEQILIVSFEYGFVYVAVHPNDPNPIWRVGNADYLAIDYEHDRIVFQDRYDRSLWRMRLDGRELIQLVSTPVWWRDWSLDKTEPSLIYRVSEGEWRQISLDGEQDELVYQSAGYPDYWGRSPQERWFIFVDSLSTGGSAIFRTRLNGEIVQQLTPELVNLGMPYEQYSIVWMTAPITRWNYLRLGLLATTCIGLPITWGGVRRYFRKTPLHQAL